MRGSNTDVAAFASKCIPRAYLHSIVDDFKFAQCLTHAHDAVACCICAVSQAEVHVLSSIASELKKRLGTSASTLTFDAFVMSRKFDEL